MTQEPGLYRCPQELVEQIASYLEPADLSAVVRISTRLHFSLQEILYDRAFTYDRKWQQPTPGRGVLGWAAQLPARKGTLTALLRKGADIDKGGRSWALLEMVASWAEKDILEKFTKACIRKKFRPGNALRAVAARGRIDLLQYLLDELNFCPSLHSMPLGSAYYLTDITCALWDAIYYDGEPVAQFLCRYLDISESVWATEQTAREGGV